MLERDISIINENASAIISRGHAEVEKLLSQIDELAHLLCEEAGEEEIFFRDRVFREKYLSSVSALRREGKGVNGETLDLVDRTASLFVRGALCRGICDLLGISGVRSVSTFFDEVGGDDRTVCYVRNHNSDKAYLAFAGVLSEPKAIYAEDFTQACESVYYGRSTYCILPVSNSTDGRLGSFRNLLIKYALKTVCVTAVGDEDSKTVFALVKKELEIPKDEGSAYLDIRLPQTSDVSEVTAVAEVCSMRATEVSYYEGGHCDLTLTVSEDGICGFLAYLNLEHPDFIAVGMYKKI